MGIASHYRINPTSNRLPRKNFVSRSLSPDEVPQIPGFWSQYWSKLLLCFVTLLFSLPTVIFSAYSFTIAYTWRGTAFSIIMFLFTAAGLIASIFLPWRWYSDHKTIRRFDT